MGKGIIQVFPKIWEEVLGKPSMTEAWHKALLLPDIFQVVETHIPDNIYGQYGVIVESDAIPSIDGNAQLIEPMYCREDEKVVLDHIEVWSANLKKHEVIYKREASV